jgi:predicted RNA binding protein YcfA (HicA-like mRNA interferase family)
MKRTDLIRYLEKHGCEFLREGGSHTVYVNRPAQRASSIPRHREINDFLARKICRDLQVPEPTGKK